MISPRLIRNRHDLKAAVAQVARYDAFVIDVETTSLDPTSNEVTWVGLASYGQVHLIPLAQTKGRLLRAAYSEMVVPPDHEREVLKSGKLSQRRRKIEHPAVFGDPGEQLDPAVVFTELEPLLFSGKRIIGHNVKFDIMTIAKYYDGVLPDGPFEDTMLMTHVLDENRRSYELKEIIPDMLRIRNPILRKEFYPKLGKHLAEEPIDRVSYYLAKDCYDCWLLWKHQRRLLEQEKLLGVLRLEMDLYPAVIRMETYGATIDIARMNDIATRLYDEIEWIQEQCWTLAGEPFNLTDTNRKRDLLFQPKKLGGQGLKPLTVTPKKGEAQVTQVVLAHYAPTNDLARLFLRWSEIFKTHSTYIVGFEERMKQEEGDHVVHTSFTQHGVVTGRLSSRGPNIQNIPRESEIRGLFISRPGSVLIVADYDQIELRVLAHFCQDPVMMAIFERGEDIHAGTAATLLNRPVEEVTAEERQIGKGCNFAAGYGAGAVKVAATARIPVARAEIFLNRYYERFANIKPWKRRVIVAAHRRGVQGDPERPPYVMTLLGRRRRLPDLYSEDSFDRSRAERQAINTIVQGTAAEIMKIAMIKVDQAFVGTPFRMLFTVHDELVSSAPEHLGTRAKEVVVAAMRGITLQGQPIISVPLEVSCGIATRWSEAKK
jgi:DNA polymerase I-like protein with 3'-5' exonuclease and polymerase domains